MEGKHPEVPAPENLIKADYSLEGRKPAQGDLECFARM